MNVIRRYKFILFFSIPCIVSLLHSRWSTNGNLINHMLRRLRSKSDQFWIIVKYQWVFKIHAYSFSLVRVRQRGDIHPLSLISTLVHRKSIILNRHRCNLLISMADVLAILDCGTLVIMGFTLRECGYDWIWCTSDERINKSPVAPNINRGDRIYNVRTNSALCI